MRATEPEPRADIEAQLAALCGKGRKKAVYISAHNYPKSFVTPVGCHVGRRDSGALVCRDEALANWFSTAPDITDREMATALDYPNDKWLSFAHGCPVAIQIRNRADHVIQECLVDAHDLHNSISHLWPYVEDGAMHFLTAAQVMQRRLVLADTNKDEK